MISALLRSFQASLLAQGVEFRKVPAHQASQLPVFQLAVNLLMAQRQPSLSFIQVGANDGVYVDPLRSYVQRFGWRGVLVEPQPDVFARLVENYRDQADRLIFENVAIAPRDRQVVLYRVPGLTAVADQTMQDSLSVTSAHPQVVARQGGVAAHQLEQVLVPAVRLDELIERHALTDLDLLQIDCEGYDGEVLQAIDLSRHRPRLIQFEHGHMARGDLDALERRLAGTTTGCCTEAGSPTAWPCRRKCWRSWPRPCPVAPGLLPRRRSPDCPARPQCAAAGCTRRPGRCG
jgi:FkbM family methyltransferase